MVDALFYDESEFNARPYAAIWDIVSTKLGLCLQKGLTAPSRHDYGTIYVLVSKEREHLFYDMIQSHRSACKQMIFQRELVSYKDRTPDEVRRAFRLRGVFVPFDDVVQDHAVDAMIVEEDAKRLADMDAGVFVGKETELTNELDFLLKANNGGQNAGKRKYRKSVL